MFDLQLFWVPGKANLVRDNMGMKHSYLETDGGYIWRNWRISLSKFAPKLFQ
jgi:hypothetical protein